MSLKLIRPRKSNNFASLELTILIIEALTPSRSYGCVILILLELPIVPTDFVLFTEIKNLINFSNTCLSVIASSKLCYHQWSIQCLRVLEPLLHSFSVPLLTLLSNTWILWKNAIWTKCLIDLATVEMIMHHVII